MSVSMLSEQLILAGVQTDVFTTTANGKVELDVIANETTIVDGVSVTYFKRLTKDHSHFSPALFRKLWISVKSYDIVHIHAWWNLVSLFSAFIAILRGVTVIISPRGTLSPYSFQNKNIGPKWLIHHLFGKALMTRSFFLATSTREKDAIFAIINAKEIEILPNFVKLPQNPIVSQHKTSEVLKLLFFSRIEQKKGLDILFEALAHVNIPYTLSIAGNGDATYIEELKKLASKYNLTNKIDWLGFQKQNKFSLLNSFDLFVLPSHDENFGNAVIESLASGTPVLISENVGLADYIEKNDLGWICKTNPESISAIINRIGNGENEKLKTIRAKASNIIYADFKPENLILKYKDYYNKIARATQKNTEGLLNS